MSEPAGAPSAASLPRPAARPGRAAAGGGTLVAAIFVVSLNLRAPMAQVPPLADAIEADLHLSGAAVGLVTALPVLCMGLFAPVAQRLAHRVGREATVSLGLVFLLVGVLLRLAGAIPAALYGGTLLVGIGIAVAGTVLPGIIKEFFPGRPGLVTGIYMFSMTLGTVVVAALAVPSAALLGSWQASLGTTALVVLVGLAAWWPIVRRVNDHDDPEVDPAPAGGLPWRSRTAWVVASYLATQSTLFYSVLAWVPPSYTALGSAPERAGLLLSAFTAAQLVGGIGAPALSDRVRDRRYLLLGAAACGLVGTAGVTFARESLPWLLMVLLGLGLGAGFSLGLVHLVAYAPTPAASARLSAMAFLVGYCCAAVGPSVLGLLRDLTGGFTVPWSVLLGITVAQLAVVRLMRPGRTVEA